MGTFLNNPRKLLLLVKIGALDYGTLLLLAESVFLKMSGNLTFATPSPSMATLQTDLTALKDAMSLIGTKRNKGSHASVVACRAAAQTVRIDLIALIQYIISTLLPTADVYAYNQALMTAGFGQRHVRVKAKKLGPATFIKQINTLIKPAKDGHITWKRSLALIKGYKVSGYNVYVNGALVGNTTQARYQVISPGGAIVNVQIEPMNAFGVGTRFSFAMPT